MNPPERPQSAILPELEQMLVAAARRPAVASRFGRRRWVLAVAAASLLLVGGAAAAVTGVLRIAAGESSGRTYSIESRLLPSGSAGRVCLQLRFDGGPPTYGCGHRPSAERPFGPLVVDASGGGEERIVYGLVATEIARVRILGGAGSETEARTAEKAGLPGRFFTAVAPRDGRVELVGYGAGGEEVARLGSLDPPAHPPRSKAEAIAQGDPAGFAPTSPAPQTYLYEGRRIAPSTATRLELACLQEATVLRCYDSEDEASAAGRALRRGSNRPGSSR